MGVAEPEKSPDPERRSASNVFLGACLVLAAVSVAYGFSGHWVGWVAAVFFVFFAFLGVMAPRFRRWFGVALTWRAARASAKAALNDPDRQKEVRRERGGESRTSDESRRVPR